MPLIFYIAPPRDFVLKIQGNIPDILGLLDPEREFKQSLYKYVCIRELCQRVHNAEKVEVRYLLAPFTIFTVLGIAMDW